MSKYNFETSIDRKATNSIRWDVEEGKLPLNIADMDFMVMPEITEAITKRAKQSCYGYTFVSECYYQAYIRWWKNHHNTELKKEWFLFSNSVVGSVDSLLKHLGNPGDQVAMITPIYNVFFNCIKNNQMIVKECEFIYRENLTEINWDKLEKILKEKDTKFFIFCNPHNPVGRKFEKNEINRIVNLCFQNSVFLISDEIHADINYNKDEYISLFSSDGVNYDKAILLLSPGKTFNVAGLHSSVVVIPNKELLDLVQEGLYQDDIGEPNYFAIDPVIEAYTHGDEYVNQLNSFLYENKEYLREFLLKNELNLKIIGSDFTYLLWLDISKYCSDSIKFCKELEKKTGLIAAPGANYGSAGEGFIRLNIATTRKNIEDACNRLLVFLKGK